MVEWSAFSKPINGLRETEYKTKTSDFSYRLNRFSVLKSFGVVIRIRNMNRIAYLPEMTRHSYKDTTNRILWIQNKIIYTNRKKNINKHNSHCKIKGNNS